jgi:hypothetical protein
MVMPTEPNRIEKETSMRKPGREGLWWRWAVMLAAVMPGGARAQAPDALPGPAPVCTRRGALHRMFHHTAHTLEDKFIGYPETFIEPPLGSYINRQFAVQVAKADRHRFTVYRSDFLPGTDLFSPMGASRFNLMFARLPAWMGPLVVEWTPDQPALAQARRRAVIATLEQAGQPILADRVVIGPSPYPGGMGVDAANNFAVTTVRSQMAGQQFPLSPTESASIGVR